MAGLKVCKRCGMKNPVGEPVCLNPACDSNSFVLYPEDREDSGHETQSANCDHNQPNRPARSSASVVLQCPWGEETLAGRFALGRDPDFSPVASRLDTYDNVSRRHAELSIDGQAVRLQDFQSVNGTFVNGQRIEPFVSVPLCNGDEIRLAKDVRLRLRFIE